MIDDLTLKRVTSYKWLKATVSGRIKDFVNSMSFEPYTISKKQCGEKFDFYIGNPTGKSWYGSTNDEIDDENIEMNFTKKELINPGAIVIECGAHHGAFTILLSRWVGDDGQVIVIEPMPDNVEIIHKNIHLNGLRNVTVLGKAAGPAHGRVAMKRRSNAAVSSTPSRATVQVECVTLDEIAAKLNVIPSLVKIDVEGFEYKVLQGCKSILSYNPAILLEVHNLLLPRYGNTFDELWNFVNPDVYDIFIQSSPNQQPVPYSTKDSPGSHVHLFFKPRSGGPVVHDEVGRA
jgi:FkbM family methyltransferase